MFCLRHSIVWMSLLLAASARLTGSASSTEEEIPTATLHNGITVPLVGLGCASGVRQQHVSSALEAGYRFLDTAQSYNWGYHEDEVGRAVQDFRRVHPGETIFVQTKIHPEDLGYEATRKAVAISLERQQTKTLDSVLIHKPHCWEGACTKEPEGTWQDSWKALEEFYEQGVVRAIGICDVSSKQLLDDLLSQKVKPHIIQNWMDPLHQDTTMRELIQEAGILYQAYSSLGTQWHHFKGYDPNPVVTQPTLVEIANAHDADVGQVVVHWATKRHGISVLPASTNPSRQAGNLNHSFSFALSEPELDRIDALDGRLPPKPKRKPSKGVVIRFHNAGDNEDRILTTPIDLYWVQDGTGEEHFMSSIEPHHHTDQKTYHGHTFRFKDPMGSYQFADFVVDKAKGREQKYLIRPLKDTMDEDDEEL